MPPRWIDPSDLRAVGDAETCVDCWRWRLLGLHIRKTAGGTLGMLAVKCTGDPDNEQPVSLAIVDTPFTLDLPTNRQSNHQRMRVRDDRGDDE